MKNEPLESYMSKKHLLQLDMDIYRMKTEEPTPSLVKTLASYGLTPEKTSLKSLDKLFYFFRDKPTAEPTAEPIKQPNLLW